MGALVSFVLIVVHLFSPVRVPRAGGDAVLPDVGHGKTRPPLLAGAGVTGSRKESTNGHRTV